ncbi:HAD family hydrolase [Natronomonas sp.]|uniref:HAD family hydrolase n=1 Tax=Natronomonas sp. TaxID=2184060 RepID=UPI002629A65F|nr:HAD family hydrolase [Natronomonas sp.]
MSFSAVLFDLDGTLCERTQSAAAVYAGAFEAAAVEPFGEPGELWAALAEPPDHDDRVGYFAAGFAIVAAKHGRAPTDARGLARGILETIDNARVRPTEGAIEAIEAAGRVGPVGLLTNGPRSRQRTKLDALPFGDAFETTVYAADLRRRKPNREPFERALGSLSVTASEALYVGDSLEYDVAGAQNAGLEVAWCRPEADVEPAPYDPEYVIDSPAEIERVLDGDG